MGTNSKRFKTQNNQPVFKPIQKAIFVSCSVIFFKMIQTTSTNPKLDKQLKKLDEKLTRLLHNLKVYSEDQLNRKPSENGWSIIQVMHHLMLAESGSIKYVRKKLSYNPELKNAGVKTALRELALNTYLNSPIKRKAPDAISGDNLPAHASFWKTAQEWKQQRLELREFLETMPPDLLKKEVYKHPFVGRLSIMGMLRFFENHFDRHNKQIKRITRNYYV
jgi:hypothetical protein